MVRLPGFGDRMPKQLSGGQQQRVALARAIVIKPSVLLLDEPLSALDRRLRQEMQVELLRIQRESGLTTIFVTHDQEEALTLSDKVAILDRGRIVQIGEPATVYERPTTRFAAEFLGDSNFLDRQGRRWRSESCRRHVIRADRQHAAGQWCRRDACGSPGEDVDLDTGKPTDNGLHARITTVIYAGPVLSYILETRGWLAAQALRAEPGRTRASRGSRPLRSTGRPNTRLPWRTDTMSLPQLSPNTLHVVIDMQRLFAEETAWHTPVITDNPAQRNQAVRSLPP